MRNRTIILIVTIITITAASMRLKADTGTCGGVTTTLPFTDVMSSIFFCQIAEAYFSGLTNGTTATTYSPSSNVTREQMAAFMTRTMDQSLKHKSKRAALDQFWTTQTENDLGLTGVGTHPLLVASDGADLWVANVGNHTVSRVKAADGSLLGTWTSANSAVGVLPAIGKVFVTGFANPGKLYQIDPSQSPGAVTTVTNSLGAFPVGIGFDGQRIWTANFGTGAHNTGSISIVDLTSVTVTTVTTGFDQPRGVIYDGANIWVTDQGDNMLKKLDSSGSVIVTVSVGNGPEFPGFDGTNIWVPNQFSGDVSVVRATGGLAGTVLATLTGATLPGGAAPVPNQAAFDGERILVTNQNGDSVSLWKASDMTPIGTFPAGTGTDPYGVCSDGLSFWLTLFSPGKLARF